MHTYKQAFDLITTAYLENKLNPYDGCQCFIGNLLGGKEDIWMVPRPGANTRMSHHPRIAEGLEFIKSAGPYTPEQVFGMERNFLRIIAESCGGGSIFSPSVVLRDGCMFNRQNHPAYEKALFRAMESTLEMLKAIHIALGEEIEETPFLKRQLQLV